MPGTIPGGNCSIGTGGPPTDRGRISPGSRTGSRAECWSRAAGSQRMRTELRTDCSRRGQRHSVRHHLPTTLVLPPLLLSIEVTLPNVEKGASQHFEPLRHQCTGVLVTWPRRRARGEGCSIIEHMHTHSQTRQFQPGLSTARFVRRTTRRLESLNSSASPSIGEA